MKEITLGKKDIQELWLSIDQVSELTHVSKTTLRYWEKLYKEFLKPKRKAGKSQGYGRRMYSANDLKLIRAIKKLHDEEHLTNKGIQIRLKKLFPAGSYSQQN